VILWGGKESLKIYFTKADVVFIAINCHMMRYHWIKNANIHNSYCLLMINLSSTLFCRSINRLVVSKKTTPEGVVRIMKSLPRVPKRYGINSRGDELRIIYMLSSGMSVYDVSQNLGLSVKYVYKLKSEGMSKRGLMIRHHALGIIICRDCIMLGG